MYRLLNRPRPASVSRTPRKLDQVPSSSTRKPEYTSDVASSMVTIRSHTDPGTHSCDEPSWCTSSPGIGARSRRRRGVPRRFPFDARPDSCSRFFTHVYERSPA